MNFFLPLCYNPGKKNENTLLNALKFKLFSPFLYSFFLFPGKIVFSLLADFNISMLQVIA